MKPWQKAVYKSDKEMDQQRILCVGGRGEKGPDLPFFHDLRDYLGLRDVMEYKLKEGEDAHQVWLAGQLITNPTYPERQVEFEKAGNLEYPPVNQLSLRNKQLWKTSGSLNRKDYVLRACA